MSDNQPKNPISAFLKTQSDIIALVLIVVFAAAGLLFRQKYLLNLSLVAAALNFVLIWAGSRWAKKDERIQHHRNLAAYHTLGATIIMVGLMSTMYRYNISRDIDIPFLCTIVTWFIVFMYAVVYSIIKRQQ
jgi:peptidoglycan biosynthesis protein MviN/MurJ (putative lipid II flippase)